MCARLTRTGVQLARPRPLQNERYSLDYEHLKIGNEDSVLAWFNQNVGARSLSTPLSSTLYLSVGFDFTLCPPLPLFSWGRSSGLSKYTYIPAIVFNYSPTPSSSSASSISTSSESDTDYCTSDRPPPAQPNRTTIYLPTCQRMTMGTQIVL
jgi:hypothetical protein